MPVGAQWTFNIMTLPSVVPWCDLHSSDQNYVNIEVIFLSSSLAWMPQYFHFAMPPWRIKKHEVLTLHAAVVCFLKIPYIYISFIKWFPMTFFPIVASQAKKLNFPPCGTIKVFFKCHYNNNFLRYSSITNFSNGTPKCLNNCGVSKNQNRNPKRNLVTFLVLRITDLKLDMDLYLMKW